MRSHTEGQIPLEEESLAFRPSGWENLILCQAKPSKKSEPVVLKPACFHITQFRPRFHWSQGSVESDLTFSTNSKSIPWQGVVWDRGEFGG